MTEKISVTDGNPLFDAWWAGSEQILRTQSDWLRCFSTMNPSSDTSDLLDSAKESWGKCEEQFQAWLLATQEWYANNDQTADTAASYTESFAALKSMLSPSAFFNSDIASLDQVFQRLADVPDFADFAVFEKKLMRISKDWHEMRAASIEYQGVIAQAWLGAFNLYIKEVAEDQNQHSLRPKDMLQRWLDTANDFMINMQRSDKFLQAQRKLLTASTQYKLKQKDMVEAWSESLTIPTRSEIDDLHQTVYQLRREIRELRNQLKDKTPANKTSVKKSSARKTPVAKLIKTDRTKPEQVSP